MFASIITDWTGLQTADAVTLLLYLAGITVLGLWMGKTVHNTTDYFVGGRRFGKLFSTFHAFGTGTHSDQAVSVSSKTYSVGMSGIWYQFLWLFVTPFYWWIAPLFRRARTITTGDYFEARYGRSVACLFVMVGILNLMINIGVMLKGSGAVITATTGGEVNIDVAIAVMTILFVTYGVVGGLSAAVVTDFVQGLLTIVFSFILLPFALYQLGGFSGLHETVASVFNSNPPKGIGSSSEMWALIAPGEITLFYVLMIAINALIGYPTQPHNMPQANAARDDKVAQVAVVAGNLIKRFCTVAWALMGMCAFAMFYGTEQGGDPDQAFGLIAHDLLPKVMPGLIGIFIASLLAAVMSSCDSFMICCSGLFTHNVYRKMIAPHKSEHHYVTVGRVAGAVTVVGGVYFAYSFESVISGLELFWKIAAMMGIAFWLGLFWRGVTPAGAWVGTLASFAMLLFTSKIAFGETVVWDFDAQLVQDLPGFMVFDDKLRLPWQMVLYLSVGLIACVGTSLFTRQISRDKLDKFFAVMRTPVQPGEVIVEPMTLPVGVEPAPSRKLVDLPNWEIQKPTRRGWLGFAMTWAFVLGIMGSVWVLVRIGA